MESSMQKTKIIDKCSPKINFNNNRHSVIGMVGDKGDDTKRINMQYLNPIRYNGISFAF